MVDVPVSPVRKGPTSRRLELRRVHYVELASTRQSQDLLNVWNVDLENILTQLVAIVNQTVWHVQNILVITHPEAQT